MSVARKSKDKKCLVGAVIVSQDKLVVSTGFNGLARGVFDDDDILEDIDEKLKWICHAETNAIFNAARVGVPVMGCAIYVNKFPCFPCCNAIVQAGIRTICTQDYEYWPKDKTDPDHTRKRDLLKQARIVVNAPNHPDWAALRELMLNGNTNLSDNPTLNGGKKPVAKARRRRLSMS